MLGLLTSEQMGGASVVNLGWRVGAKLRLDAEQRRPDGLSTGRGGWRTIPHIRSGHTRRVRVAERNQAGTIVGDRQGAQGIDWHYELHHRARQGRPRPRSQHPPTIRHLELPDQRDATPPPAQESPGRAARALVVLEPRSASPRPPQDVGAYAVSHHGERDGEQPVRTAGPIVGTGQSPAGWLLRPQPSPRLQHAVAAVTHASVTATT
jgi:hypothetical protein